MLIAIRDVFAEEEPLATPHLDDHLDPHVLETDLEVGIAGADAARIDVQWTTRGDYKFHYTDSECVDLRWGKHPHDGDYGRVDGLEHFHPPPDASSDPEDVENSCIEVAPPTRVARAVLKLWRVALDRESFAPLNDGSNPT